MTYNFDIKPTKKFVKYVRVWLEQHIDRYFPTEKPDRNTRVYKSMVGGKTAVVNFSKQGISVDSDDDLSEYFKMRLYNNECDRSAKARLKRAGISLAYYVFDMCAFLIYLLIYGLTSSLTGSSDEILFLTLTLSSYFAVFFLTYKPIYENTGERTWRTAFVQGGGIFTVLHIVFFILKTIAYAFYKAVKESFVIPNFTVEQIEHGRRIYNDISIISGIPIVVYFILVLLPLIISFAISSHRIFYTVDYTVKENQ